MAVVEFVAQASNVNGTIWLAGPLAANDITGALSINNGDAEVVVQLYGTVGGSSVAVLGMIAGGQYSAVDDAFGDSMVYTSLGTEGLVKPVGPALQSLKVRVIGGSGVSVFVGVYVPSRKG